MRGAPDLSTLPTERLDPIAVITEQNESRLQELVPVRIGRMLQSPFAFYRGTAALMAADLARTPSSGLHVLSCGDAHLSNFGFFASPERRLLFDLNDFDEAGYAPWEWDLKRLVTSVFLAATDNGCSRDTAADMARSTTKAYRKAMTKLSEETAFERFYAAVDTAYVSEQFGGTNKRLAKLERKARRRTSSAALAKLTVQNADGSPRIVDQPPLMQHTDHATVEQIARLCGEYVRTCPPEIRYLLGGFTFTDYVLRVVGVGSVGTRCYILLFTGPRGEPLFLQAKEAGRSVLETYGGISQSAICADAPDPDAGEGYRVVAGQRVLQAYSDPFLGWIEGYAGDQGEHVRVDYYWRQFRDMKGSIDLSVLSGKELKRTARVCAALLARAHSQSATATEIAAAYGSRRELDDQLAQFAQGYAALALADFEALQIAADEGRVPVSYGL